MNAVLQQQFHWLDTAQAARANPTDPGLEAEALLAYRAYREALNDHIARKAALRKVRKSPRRTVWS